MREGIGQLVQLLLTANVWRVGELGRDENFSLL